MQDRRERQRSKQKKKVERIKEIRKRRRKIKKKRKHRKEAGGLRFYPHNPAVMARKNKGQKYVSTERACLKIKFSPNANNRYSAVAELMYRIYIPGESIKTPGV